MAYFFGELIRVDIFELYWHQMTAILKNKDLIIVIQNILFAIRMENSSHAYHIDPMEHITLLDVHICCALVILSHELIVLAIIDCKDEQAETCIFGLLVEQQTQLLVGLLLKLENFMRFDSHLGVVKIIDEDVIVYFISLQFLDITAWRASRVSNGSLFNIL